MFEDYELESRKVEYGYSEDMEIVDELSVEELILKTVEKEKILTN